MGKWDLRSYEPTIMDKLKYDVVKTSDNVVMKDMGDYIEMLIPTSSAKGHDTYNIYLDSNGKIIRIEGHNGNAGFTGTKYY